MSSAPSNPFANLTPPTGNVMGAPQTSPSAPPSAGQHRAKISRFTAIEFTGTAMQLFGVQIVNLLLTILTLGIWTPWARVRRRRFFYNNTRVLDEGLDYLATGGNLFKGWSIVAIILVAYSFIPVLGIPFLAEGLSLLVPFLYPWIINQSLRFNARNIAWRDVRFDFKGSYLASAWYLFLFPIIGILTLGLLVPLASQAMRSYIARCYSFGTADFDSDGSIGAYYAAGIKTMLFFGVFGALIIGGVYAVLLTSDPTALLAASQALKSNDTDQLLQNLMASSLLGSVLVAGFALLYMTGAFYRALTRNVMINALRLQGGIRFRSNLSGSVLAWIMASNFIAVVLSLGLLWPWAQVRRYRYMCECTEIRPVNDMKGFVDKQVRAGHSTGDAIGEAGGIGVEF